MDINEVVLPDAGNVGKEGAKIAAFYFSFLDADTGNGAGLIQGVGADG